jgi:hypothetical protein
MFQLVQHQVTSHESTLSRLCLFGHTFKQLVTSPLYCMESESKKWQKNLRRNPSQSGTTHEITNSKARNI